MALAEQLQLAHFPVAPGSPLLELTVGEALRQQAARVPGRLALMEGRHEPDARRQWTWAELLRDSERVAYALLTQFQPGERVAVWAPNLPEWVMLQLGAALAGIVVVTVNPALKSREVEYILRQSRSAGVFHAGNFRGLDMAATLRDIRPRLPELRAVVALGDFGEFLAAAGPVARLPEVRPMDPVMIQYTSGTTGFPKGALLHHRGLVNNARLAIERIHMDGDAVYLSMMPLFHTAGCVMGVIGCSVIGATQVLACEFDPALVLELIETTSATHMLGVPTMLVALLEHPDLARRNLSSMKLILSGGSTVPVDLVRRVRQTLGAEFSILFGQTETSPVITQTRPEDEERDMAETIGLPLPHTEVRIVSPETGETVPCGQVGELCTRGFHVMHGYFEMPEATARAIDADGWLHTGDLCSMDTRGYCRIEGRLKDMIIRGGENIYPREIEELLFAHPEVLQAAVLGLPDEKWGEQVAAFVQLRPGSSIGSEALHGYVRDNLAAHKAPRTWVRVDAFPLTGSGKIQKFALREQFLAGSLKADF